MAMKAARLNPSNIHPTPSQLKTAYTRKRPYTKKLFQWVELASSPAKAASNNQ